MKEKIIEALKATMPDIQSQEPFEHAADLIAKLFEAELVNAVERAIRVYHALGDDDEL